MKRTFIYLIMPLLVFALSCSHGREDRTMAEKLREWRRGVWQLADGGYAIYTDEHYFVVSASGDSAQANIYCGASRIAFTEKGIARRQDLRIRKFPDGELAVTKNPETAGGEEPALNVDMSQFSPGICTVHDGVIYDSVTEVTDLFILLATCNGDMEKIFSDGHSVYMPAAGGEFWAHRIESW
jgi:hypothetical protein